MNIRALFQIKYMYANMYIYRYGAPANQLSIETDEESSGAGYDFELDSNYLLKPRRSKWREFTDCLSSDWKAPLSRCVQFL